MIFLSSYLKPCKWVVSSLNLANPAFANSKQHQCKIKGVFVWRWNIVDGKLWKENGKKFFFFWSMFGWVRRMKNKWWGPSVFFLDLLKCFFPKMKRKLSGSKCIFSWLTKMSICMCTWASSSGLYYYYYFFFTSPLDNNVALLLFFFFFLGSIASSFFFFFFFWFSRPGHASFFSFFFLPGSNVVLLFSFPFFLLIF